jgi:uncharacterized protein YkwD
MRRIAPAVVVVALIVPSAPAVAAPSAQKRVTVDARAAAVLVNVNQVRRAHGLRALRASARLTAAAAEHSREMAARGYFQHASFDGTAFWQRIQRFYSRHGYRTWSVGENLLWSSPDVGAARAVQMWMNSPEHRANLLSRSWREIGLSAVHVASAPGVYRGDAVTVVTADFGIRR